ncbi:hypothetical protein TcasGA2_TC031786 [Tribolium castaneum]|uniref:PiggyBac transposable element-derived protein domain-containing protein n=1 Tax=Tribolium castaneum TaxID=7070 RepID=A0A139W9Z9_TRICA|nr:hypothetical protein TcasGA2_TC031786 [Tribolium castaneum]
MAAFRNLTYDAIFGNKKSLRPGVDDEKLLELLNADCSDIDISDEENELDPEPEEIFNDELQNEQTEEEEANDQREEREDSEEDDDEDDLLPLSVVRDNLLVAQAQNSTSKAKRTSWKRKSTFTPPNFDWTEPENDFERRLAWTAKDYLSMYFTDEDFQKNCDYILPLYLYLNIYTNKKMYGTGTIMKSRIPSAVHLTSDKMMSKMGCGASEQLLREDEKIIIVKWYDMKPVLLASTGQGSQPYDECKRWSKKEAKYIQVPRPNIVSKYNECMGGIDLIDRMRSYYRIQARCKKWTVRVILHFFDLAMANSWILYRRDKKRLNTTNRNIQQYLDFKIEFATYLLMRDIQYSLPLYVEEDMKVGRRIAVQFRL